MKEEDRREACESLQDIETGLTYWLIESYKRREIENVFVILELIRPFHDIHKEICPENMR